MKKVLLFVFLISLFVSKTVLAQTQGNTPPSRHEGSVIEIIDSVEVENSGLYQKLKVQLPTGENIEVENDPQLSARNLIFKKGDKVILHEFSIGGNEKTFVITDYKRTPYLIFTFLVFATLALIVGKKYGFYSLVGLGFTFLIIFKFILPQIMLGRNPVFITILASVFIIPVTFYLSHGFNKKTHVAIVSTVLALIFTAIFTAISVNIAKLTGYSSEDAMFLQVAKENINMKGVLLAGIIIGFLGVLDDVTVSQSSVVMQLKKANRGYGTTELYSKAMEIGRDHITSMINTLVLVYAGASMPLLLLFINSPQPFLEVLNLELVADEVIRTLLGSIGLILAVPLSTFFAALVADND